MPVNVTSHPLQILPPPGALPIAAAAAFVLLCCGACGDESESECNRPPEWLQRAERAEELEPVPAAPAEPVVDDMEAGAADMEGAQPSALAGHALLAIDPQQDPYKAKVPEQCVELGDEYASIVRICVDAAGSVSGVSILKDSLPIIDTQLPYIIARWEYNPYLREGVPTPFCYSLRYRVR